MYVWQFYIGLFRIYSLMGKIDREKYKVMHNVFDDFTNRTLFQLISQGHFIGLLSPIMIGKESNVFSARTQTGLVAVKIYRLEACDFNRMYEYIREDPRYADLRGKRRKIIFSWVQREFRNLLKAREAQVNVPKPIAFGNNVLVMEFIGGEEPALQLKDATLSDPAKYLDEIIQNIRRLYGAGLIHGDLSPFNILDYENHPILIDFSQCSPISISRSKEFLDRDIQNCLNHFKKLGIVRNLEETRSAITSGLSPLSKRAKKEAMLK